MLVFLLGLIGLIFNPKNRAVDNRRPYGGIVLGIFLVMLGIKVGEVKSNPSLGARPTTAKHELSSETKQEVWIVQSQEGVRKRLKDPSSAEFRNVRFNDADGTPVVCGEVNSKNSYGGYGGFQRFVASSDVLVFLEDEVSDFGRVWATMCSRS
jgi:hypothetical protein